MICSPDADAEPEADHDGFGYDENDPLSKKIFPSTNFFFVGFFFHPLLVHFHRASQRRNDSFIKEKP